jgi:hypothetical protein
MSIVYRQDGAQGTPEQFGQRNPQSRGFSLGCGMLVLGKADLRPNHDIHSDPEASQPGSHSCRTKNIVACV